MKSKKARKGLSLPSQHQISDPVMVFLMPKGPGEPDTFPGFNGWITGVHFYEGKVKYDVELKFYGDYASRIYNVDSVLIQKT